jgi:histidine triad (HIT) family protein
MTDPNCVFCSIIAGKAPADLVYRDDLVTAFHDNRPIAPIHILIVPNRHLASVNEVPRSDEPLLGHLITTARQLAEQAGVAETGYRLVINTGPHSGQAVFHLHLHLIGGRPLPMRIG